MSQAARARAFVDALVASGVRELAISPGSRSTPLALAAIAHPGLRCRPVIDERSAAFFALGQAKVTGRPSALLCTSGTAGAHYYPAILEASYARAPLIAITADRPPELLDCGAPQTIDQRDLFGRHVRASIDLGAPEPDADGLRAVARKAVQAAALALGPVPGPVHVNAPARKPLEPTAGDADPAVAAPPRVHAPTAVADPAAVAELAAACRRAERGLIACGPAPIARRAALDGVRRLARATGFPLLAEASSQLRFGAGGCDGFDALLRAPAFRDRHAPDLIVQIGDAPVSTGWREYMRHHRDCPRWILRDAGWADPHNGAAVHLVGDVTASIGAVADALGDAAPATPWAGAFAAGDAAVWRAVDAALAGEPGPSEGGVARATVAALPAGGLLAVGNSSPIRSIDAFCRGDAADVAVWHQRGVAGIDGLISGAAGAADAHGRPTALLVGDVSFAHDLTGLAIARDVDVPLAVVVVDNDGGRLFEQLPIARAADPDAFERHWATPPRCDFERAAGSFGVPFLPYRGPETIAAALERRGCSLIHAPVAANADQVRQLWLATAEALA